MHHTTPLRAKKSLGQNFLIQPAIAEKIALAGQLKEGDYVIEIGPGTGVLTHFLLETGAKVLAIEKDTSLIPLLRGKFRTYPTLELIGADALEFSPPEQQYSIIANIPYYITSPLIDHFLRKNPGQLPQQMVLLVQREVAKKLCAKPPHMNVLALHVQPFGKIKKLFDVSRKNFEPTPRVDSAVIHIVVSKKTAKIPSVYFDLVHAAFAKKRKMLRATLPSKLLEKAGIDPMRRPETLSVQEWLKLGE